MKNFASLYILFSLLILTITGSCQESSPVEFGVSVDFNESHAINKDVYGVNNYVATRPYYTNYAGFIAKYNDLGKPLIRYPGGTFSNYYDFKTGFSEAFEGGGKKDSLRETSINAGITKYKLDTGGEDYRKFCDFVKKTGAEFTLSLNIVLHTAEENRELFEGFKAEGVEPKYVEMGNEVYNNSYQPAIPDVEKYIEIARANMTVLREVFPDVKVGVVCPSHIYKYESFLDKVALGESDRQIDWFNKLQNEDFFDAVIIHMYSVLGLDSDTPQDEYYPYKEAYKFCISHADGKFEKTVDAMRAGYPGKDIWLTEYHIRDYGLTNYGMRLSYMGGFFTASFMLKLFNTPEVTVSNWHSLVQWLRFSNTTSLLPDNYDFTPLVNYHLFKVFKDPVSNSDYVVPLALTGMKKYQGVGEYTGVYDDMEGSLFYSETKASMIIFNKLEQPYTISEENLLEALSGLDEATLDSCREFGPSESMSLDEALNSETAYSDIIISAENGYYTLNPYSIYTFSFSHLTRRADLTIDK
ncbi:MAG: hypothetical protein DRQ39_08845 [Gammaproteobacteria bacterium]|nr:MAG: hypothetical protein DRQ39_08845 [Gammaproteobacteria bacterium]